MGTTKLILSCFEPMVTLLLLWLVPKNMSLVLMHALGLW